MMRRPFVADLIEIRGETVFMRRPGRFVLPAGILAVSLAAASAVLAADAAALVREGEDLYRRGAYAEALKRFEGALAAGHETGAVLYQAGACAAQVLGSKERDLEFKKRAVPLLEKEVAGGAASLDSYYYLAAVYINDLHDPVKGTDAARKGAAALSVPGRETLISQTALFRSGRLYSFLGKDKEAADYYEKSVEAAGAAASPDRAAMKLALESLATIRFSQKNFEASARAYESLLQIDPLRDRERHQYGLAFLLAGKLEEAEKAWRSARGDELRTELSYLAQVVKRYRQVSASAAPATPKATPAAAAASNPASLDDEALGRKIVSAAEPLRVIRQREEKEKQEKEEKARTEREEAAKNRPHYTPEQIKALFAEALERAKAQGAQGGSPQDGNDPQQALRNMGLNPSPAPAPPAPPSQEKIAGEREFLEPLLEYVKRGHLIRNFCFENGLIELIFR